MNCPDRAVEGDDYKRSTNQKENKTQLENKVFVQHPVIPPSQVATTDLKSLLLSSDVMVDSAAS